MLKLKTEMIHSCDELKQGQSRLVVTLFVMSFKIKLTMHSLQKKHNSFCYFWVLGSPDGENMVKIYNIPVLEPKTRCYKFFKILL